MSATLEQEGAPWWRALILTLINASASVYPSSYPPHSVIFSVSYSLPQAPLPHPSCVSHPVVPFSLLFTVRLLGRIALNFTLPFYPLLIPPQSTTLIMSLSFLEAFHGSPFLLALYSDIPQPGCCCLHQLTPLTLQEFYSTCGSQDTLFCFQSPCLCFCGFFVLKTLPCLSTWLISLALQIFLSLSLSLLRNLS